MLSFRGYVVRQNKGMALRICSSSLANQIGGKRFSIMSYKNNKIILKKSVNGMKASSNGVSVRIAVSEYFNREIKRIPVNVIFKGVNLKNVIQNNVALGSSIYERNDVPENVYWVKAYLNITKNKGTKIVLSRKALVRLATKSETRGLFQKISNGILIRKSNDISRGRKLYATSRNRKTISHITEIAFPNNLAPSFNGLLGIPIKEFGLTYGDFSENFYEKALLNELERRGLDVSAGTTHTYGDIFLGTGGIIEITTFNPNGRKDSRHKSPIMQLRGRIFEAQHMAIHRNIKPIFVVIHSDWRVNKHLIEEVKEAEKHDVYTIFTDFSRKWEKDVSNQIIGIL